MAWRFEGAWPGLTPPPGRRAGVGAGAALRGRSGAAAAAGGAGDPAPARHRPRHPGGAGGRGLRGWAWPEGVASGLCVGLCLREKETSLQLQTHRVTLP